MSSIVIFISLAYLLLTEGLRVTEIGSDAKTFNRILSERNNGHNERTLGLGDIISNLRDINDESEESKVNNSFTVPLRRNEELLLDRLQISEVGRQGILKRLGLEEKSGELTVVSDPKRGQLSGVEKKLLNHANFGGIDRITVLNFASKVAASQDESESHRQRDERRQIGQTEINRQESKRSKPKETKLSVGTSNVRNKNVVNRSNRNIKTHGGQAAGATQQFLSSTESDGAARLDNEQDRPVVKPSTRFIDPDLTGSLKEKLQNSYSEESSNSGNGSHRANIQPSVSSLRDLAHHLSSLVYEDYRN